jgi:Uma2 family endonuclease
MATKTRLTLEEFLALPEEKPYAEFFRGEVRRKVTPSGNHQFAAKRIVRFLDRYGRETGGEAIENVRVLFVPGADDEAGFIPDVAFYVDRSRLKRRSQVNPPDLAVEIRSDRQSLRLLREKCEVYVAHGVRAAWLIDLDALTVEVWEPGGRRTVLTAQDTLRFDSFEAVVAGLLDLSDYPDE